MRILLLLSFMFAVVSPGLTQTPAVTLAQTAPAAPAAAPRPQAQRRAATQSAAVTARTGLMITTTDPVGAPLRGVRVLITGPSDRSGTTDSMGELRVTGMQAGTYRLRFTGDEVDTFEREVTVRAGAVPPLDIMLSPAPPPPPPPPPPAPVAVAAPVGPLGSAMVQSVPSTLEKEFIGNQERRETLLSCSGNTRTTLIQLNGPLPDRVYSGADATYYVVGGEGTIQLAGRELPLPLNSVVSVPRGTLHAFNRSGRRTLILVAVLGGEPCETAK